MAKRTSRVEALRKYENAKSNARIRGIEWRLTFAQWWDIWQRSGKWTRRGSNLGCFCMCRPGDIGPYAVGNVRIVRVERNMADAQITAKRKRQGKPHRPNKGRKFGKLAERWWRMYPAVKQTGK